MKNYIPQVLWLCFMVTGLLLIIAPSSKETKISGVTFRKMDILQDLRVDTTTQATEVVPTDSIAFDSISTDSFTIVSMHSDTFAPAAIVPLQNRVSSDTALFGNSIEDYSPDKRGLTRFFSAIDSIKTHKNTVRVAFLGDSFVEGDILLGDMRDTLQTVWGGNGVGYVPITSEVARFKRTLSHEYKGWATYSIVKNQKDHKQPFGIDGHVYYPEAEAKIHYEGTRFFAHTGTWGTVRLFYQAEKNVRFVWQNKDFPPKEDQLKAEPGKISQWKWSKPENDISAFAMRFTEVEGLKVYGASLESGPGFYLDNFSVRGNTGGKLKLIAATIARQFDALQGYDLIVLQLGLNAVTPTLNNLPWYKIELDQTYAHVRQCFPGKPILIVSVPDRAGKINGALATMPSVPAIVSMQRELAQKHGLLFWDMYHAMGGPGTMIRFSSMKPHSWANKDYTHLTHEGGKIMGRMFANLLINEKKKTDNGRKNVQ